MTEKINTIKQLVERINDADVAGLSAQLAYFFLLSLFPFLLFLVTLMRFIPLSSESVMQFLDSFLPGDVSDMIRDNLETLVNNRSGGLLSIGILGTIWSASNGFNAITKSFNKAYQVEEDRSVILCRLMAIDTMLDLVLVIAVAAGAAVFRAVMADSGFGPMGVDAAVDAWDGVGGVVTAVSSCLVLCIIYILAPNEKIKMKDVVLGAVFATIAWQVVSLGFSYYVNNLGNYSATYGSLGTVIVLMIWLYLSGIIITTGGVINAYVKERRLS